MSKTKVATKSTLDDNAGVAIDFSDGTRLTCAFADLSPEIITNLAIHGAKQKIGDSYSGEQDPSAAFALASKVVEQLLAGKWSAVREGGGGRISDLAQALSRVTGQEVATCVAKLAEMDKKAKQDLRNHDQVKVVLAEIALEKAKERAEGEGASPLQF